MTYQAMSSTGSRSQLCSAIPILPLCSVLTLQFVFLFVRPKICLKPSLALVITLVADNIEEFLKISIESWPDWDLSPRPLISFQTL